MKAETKKAEGGVQLFNVKVRHGGNLMHEVPKDGVTMNEIILLRHIHGDDAVPDSLIKPAGTKDINPDTELFHLARAYASATEPASGKKLVEKVFSKPLIGFEAWLAEMVELEEIERQEADEKRHAEQLAARQEAFRAEVRAAVGVPAA